MPLDPARLAQLGSTRTRVSFTRKDARLYALATGFGGDPLDERELEFVRDTTRPKTCSTFATVLGSAGADAFDLLDLAHPELALHLEQRLALFAPLPADGNIILEAPPPRVEDRGEGRGALVHMTVIGRDALDERVLFETRYVSLARGDGGFGGEPPAEDDRLSASPDREPDMVIEVATRPDQALLYALTGDDNPIHTSPRAAGAAGFDRPILHGLCTYGIVERILLTGQRPSLFLAHLDARFSAPVIPGETLIIEQWNDGLGAALRVRSRDRDLVVLDRGSARFEARP